MSLSAQCEILDYFLEKFQYIQVETTHEKGHKETHLNLCEEYENTPLLGIHR